MQGVSAYDGAYGISITPQYVHVDGAKCSCIHSDGYYYHYNITFLNYCPVCHRYGGLSYEQHSGYGAVSGFTSVEGMWYCNFCDADFCLVHGTEHSYRPLGYLVPYTIPKKKKVTKAHKEKTKEEVLMDKIKKHSKQKGLDLMSLG